MNSLQRLMANGSVRFGGTVLGLMLLVAALAPFLGTVDPATMDSSFINKAVGASGLFALLDEESRFPRASANSLTEKFCKGAVECEWAGFVPIAKSEAAKHTVGAGFLRFILAIH